MSEQDQEYVIITAAANEICRQAKLGYKLAGVLPGYADHSDAVIMQRRVDRSGAHAALHDVLDKQIDALQQARESHRRSLKDLCARVEALEADNKALHGRLDAQNGLIDRLHTSQCTDWAERSRRSAALADRVQALEAAVARLIGQAHGHADRDLIEAMHQRMDRLEAEMVAVRRDIAHEAQEGDEDLTAPLPELERRTIQARIVGRRKRPDLIIEEDGDEDALAPGCERCGGRGRLSLYDCPCPDCKGSGKKGSDGHQP